VPDRVAFGALIALLLLAGKFTPALIEAAGSMSLAGRIAVAALLTAPIGFFMGMPFPKGSLRVGELVDWGLAVNGVASVMGSTLVILVAITQGFHAAMLLATLAYVVAGLLITARKVW
jgi:hypothetical protein